MSSEINKKPFPLLRTKILVKNYFYRHIVSKVQTEPFTQAEGIEEETEKRKEDFLFEYAFIDDIFEM